jgi:hypothetical protein
MMELAVQIVRFVDDEPQPGIVACEFIDANGHRHTLIDKVPMCSGERLDANSTYPRVGNPITKGTSLGLPPFGIGSMSIGENVNGSQIVIAINDGRMVVRPYL